MVDSNKENEQKALIALGMLLGGVGVLAALAKAAAEAKAKDEGPKH